MKNFNEFLIDYNKFRLLNPLKRLYHRVNKSAVYHGTGEKNAIKIIKSGLIKGNILDHGVKTISISRDYGAAAMIGWEQFPLENEIVFEIDRSVYKKYKTKSFDYKLSTYGGTRNEYEDVIYADSIPVDKYVTKIIGVGTKGYHKSIIKHPKYYDISQGKYDEGL